jgi:hypothetical protein
MQFVKRTWMTEKSWKTFLIDSRLIYGIWWEANEQNYFLGEMEERKFWKLSEKKKYQKKVLNLLNSSQLWHENE